jgi:hypothetical protein
MNFVKKLLVSALLLGAFAGAQANAVYDLGTLNVGKTEFQYLVSNATPSASSISFEDIINFNLLDASSGEFGADPIRLKVGRKLLLNITDMAISLYKQGEAPSLGSGLDFTVNTLPAGDYYLRVSGSANGTLGGIYDGEIEISPVPEPATWSLLIAGLTILGFMAYRRREKY